MMTVVTGASGHVGANLIRALVAQNRPCRALVHRDRRAFANLPIETVPADVLDVESLERAFAGAELVFHLAAKISIAGDPGGHVHATNVIGTRHVVTACLRAGVRRLVHFSSIHAFSQEPLDQPLDESRLRVHPASALAYDRSKAFGEIEIQEGLRQGLDAVIINPTAVIGPYDYYPSRMGQVFLDLYHRRLPAVIDGGFDWVDARDVVHTALVAAEKGQRGENYLLSGHWLSTMDLARLAAAITGVPAPRWTTPMWLARAAAPFALAYARTVGKDPLFSPEALAALRANRHISHQKAARAFGYGPRPLRDTVADIYDWFKQNGRL
jgi:dihydroflavonol-4-reductase